MAPLWCRLLAAMALVAGVPMLARAQDEVTPEDRQGAAEAYDRGSSAYLSRNYAQAAQYFEMADRLAPSAAALQQAVRSNQRAGNDLRAANLALRLGERYPDDAQAARLGRQALEGASERWYRVDVRCGGCSILLDGAVLDHPSFFVEPDTDHTVVAHFDTGDVERTVRGAAGETGEVAVEAPALAEPVEAETADDLEVHAPPPAAAADEGRGLSPAWLVVAGVLTLGAAGAATWSGVDALAGVDAYEADPTEEALEKGQSRERRTNILIGVASGLAAITIALAIFTDFGGSPDEEPVRASAALLPGGGALVLAGGFR